MVQKRKCGCHLRHLAIILLIFLLAQCASSRWEGIQKKSDEKHYPPVQLRHLQNHVVLENGILNVTLASPQGLITEISYNGIRNLLRDRYPEKNRGYWDIVWSTKQNPKDNLLDGIYGTHLVVVRQDEEQVELSFVRKWSSSKAQLPLNVDKRFIMLRGCSGFYSYTILEREAGWPGFIMTSGRIAFKLQPDLFTFMAISDDRQRIMPTSEDVNKSRILDYREAVVLTNPANPDLRGEVDDKYQYSSDNKDSRVHGWICSNPPTGFWMITPSNEFKTGGPMKQDLTSHAGPISLQMFLSGHYAGPPLLIEFEQGEPWKKVWGAVFMYLNSVSHGKDRLTLWSDAKQQMIKETQLWPYDFPMSDDFPSAKGRGEVSGILLVHDSYINKHPMNASSAYIGLAPPGGSGSWQTENKGYQFWTQTDNKGHFTINSIRPGKYNLYASVPGFIGDYKYRDQINVKPGSKIKLENLVYAPPRNGPTLWEIGIPDRTGAEFHIPDPNPSLTNKLYTTQPDKFRQYGLWDRYTDLYPDQDLVYEVESNNYRTDWYFAQVTRKTGNKTYIPTTWKIRFKLTHVDISANYTLQLALASATEAELQIRINEKVEKTPYFTTGLIGRDNAIARHGIHGLYSLYSVGIRGSLLCSCTNVISLTQSRGSTPWKEIMYDYIRLEGPSSSVKT